MRPGRYIGLQDRNAKLNRKFSKFRFSKISDSLKFKIPKRQNSFRSISRSSSLFTTPDRLRTVKSRLNSLEGRARRRCFPFVARYPLPLRLLTLGTPARPRVFPEASPSEPKGKAATRAMPTCAREAAAVGAEPQRSAEKTRGRAGSL